MLVPLSTVQQATVDWICAGGGSSFGLNVSLSLRFRGSLSRPALERAVAYVMQRHEGLRTRVQRVNGELLQSFAEVADSVDLTPIAVAGIAAAEAHVAARLASHLDLERNGPVLVELLKLSDDDHVLVLIISHTATDTHADDLFVAELLAAYDCHVRGTLPALPPAMSFSEYIASEAQAGSQIGEQQLQYWAKVISGCTPAIPLRATGDVARTVARGRVITLSTTAETTRRLEALASSSKVSLMAVLCTIIFLAIWQEYALEDVCAFMTHAGRDSSRLRTLGASVGRDFLIRVALRNAASLADLTKLVQTALIRSAMSSRLPFTHDRAVAQLSERGVLGSGAGPDRGARRRAHLHITDALRVGNGALAMTPGLTVERVMPGPLLNDHFQFNAPDDGENPLDAPYVGILNLLLRRDLSPEAGAPISFVAVFVDDLLDEGVVRAFLERICSVAERAGRGDPFLPLMRSRCLKEGERDSI
ncbi:MAG TPA: condensation domain-containing protein [Polyangiaceae bacterium]|nr:condensation domain-containing protein [Polyangiaceae bacterium]